MSPELIIALIGAAATIIAAVFGWLAAKRQFSTKKCFFLIGESEDITLAMRRMNDRLSVAIDGKSLANLNRCEVVCQNNGNSPLSKFSFVLKIQGGRDYVSVDLNGNAPELLGELSYEPPEFDKIGDTLIRVKLGYLNPNESITSVVYFDGITTDIDVVCRMEGVKVITKRANLTKSEDLTIEVGFGPFATVSAKLAASVISKLLR